MAEDNDKKGSSEKTRRVYAVAQINHNGKSYHNQWFEADAASADRLIMLGYAKEGAEAKEAEATHKSGAGTPGSREAQRAERATERTSAAPRGVAGPDPTVHTGGAPPRGDDGAADEDGTETRGLTESAKGGGAQPSTSSAKARQDAAVAARKAKGR